MCSSGQQARIAAALAIVGRGVAVLRAAEDASAAALAEALDLWREGSPFDAALLLPENWRSSGLRSSRNEALARLATTIREPSERKRAEKAKALLRQYQTGTFPHDLRAGKRLSGGLGLLFDVLVFGDPPSANRIRAILAEQNGSRVPFL